jgi:hypothetical protein
MDIQQIAIQTTLQSANKKATQTITSINRSRNQLPTNQYSFSTIGLRIKQTEKK